MKYTAEHIRFVKQHKNKPRKDICILFNKKFNETVGLSSIKNLCSRNDIVSDVENRGYFKKGSVPYNKGKKLDKGPNITSFKKGFIPANTKPVGYERVNRDGYIEVKIKEGRDGFRLKHRFNWEKVNGAIPKNCIIRFKNNDKLNCDIDNLFMVTQAEHALLNKINYANDIEELKPSLLASVRLDAMILDKSR